jgi:hypothetical protein
MKTTAEGGRATNNHSSGTPRLRLGPADGNDHGIPRCPSQTDARYDGNRRLKPLSCCRQNACHSHGGMWSYTSRAFCKASATVRT